MGILFSTEIVTRLQGHQASSSFVTLSGRTVVWTAAVRQFQQYPLLVSAAVSAAKRSSHTSATCISRR